MGVIADIFRKIFVGDVKPAPQATVETVKVEEPVKPVEVAVVQEPAPAVPVAEVKDAKEEVKAQVELVVNKPAKKAATKKPAVIKATKSTKTTKTTKKTK